LAHRSPQALDTFAGTLDQTQSGIGEAILAVPLPQPICERHDPGVRGDHRQIGVGVTTQDEKAVTDDLCPEPALSGSPLTQLAEHHTSCTMQQEQPAQLMRRHMDLKLDTEPARNYVSITRGHQLDPRARQREARTGVLLFPERLMLDLPASLAEDRRSGVRILGCKQGGKHS
jgi:hypothetical protein